MAIPETGAIPPSGKHWHEYSELPWAERRSRLVDTILATGDTDIIGFQASPPPAETNSADKTRKS